MNGKYRISSRTWFGIAFCIGIPLAVFGEPASQRIHINGINRVVHKNWLGVPRSADYTVYWDVYAQNPSGWSAVDPDVFERFRLTAQSGAEVRQTETKGNFATIPFRAGQKVVFVVEGMAGARSVSVSDTACAVTGKPAGSASMVSPSRLSSQGPSEKSKWHYWFPLNGRIPLALIGKGQIFDMSSNAGKFAFHMIWDFFLAGLGVWILFCSRRLRLNRVFPLDKNTLVFQGLDDNYRNRESKSFRNILNDWREKGAPAVPDLLDRIDKTSWREYPTVRIIKAGLHKHEKIKNVTGIELMREIDRSMENRAASELEQMKRKTFVEWLWNLGTLAPLLGLFGTVTGISQSFGTLALLQEDISQKELMNKLAGGIHEALWTTIEGLIVGICFMLLYYYYQTKLNWIYSKWEDMYVYVSEKL
jgi:biopolymer transport protein ExbB/TolQ